MIEQIQERIDAVRDDLDDRNRTLFDTLLFLVRFTVLAAPIYLLLWQGWDPVWLRSINATVSSHVLNLAGLETASSGTFLSAPSILVDVSVDSTGWKSMIAVTALILATLGENRRKRLYGIASGIGIVSIGNIGRITSMVYAVEVFGADYEFIHTFLWRWGLTFLVFGYWALWLHWDGSVPIQAQWED
jgi:exosortase/archaeosortase family protein